MKYYVIAGEASGDLHGSNLIKALKEIQADAQFRAWGGDLMQEAGAEIVKHYKDLAFMGFVEVVMNLKTILGNIKFCKQDIKAYQPDAVIMIDYPGFNLRLADFVKSLDTKLYYYISPQVWAWDKKRVFKIKETVDRMFVILPFEKAFYAQYEVEVDYVGHPLLDAIQQRNKAAKNQQVLKEELGLGEEPIIAVLPGSRKQEVSKMLPKMLKQTQEFPDHQFVLAVAPSFDRSFFNEYLEKYQNVKVVVNRTYDLLSIAKAAMVTSGTATLETALFRVPEVVCYQGNPISYHIAKRLVDLDYISLVNLIMDQEVVKELIQGDFNHKLLKTELGKLLAEGEYRAQMLSNFESLIQKLGRGGASQKTAQLIVDDLKA